MPSNHLDADFIARQKARLEELRKQLVSVGNAAGGDEQTWQGAAGGEPQDEGDDGQRFAQQENDEAVLNHSEGRITAIDRALEKIAEGTYGFSDESDEPIPRARLEAVPETIYTVEESEARERNARRGL
jgi:DnaK suppressor protein